ncbi:hypothetical protein [Leptolyngbya sp. O-77]|uniref:hypothetical protein n=1 Tax=Leptolyngbya sp. O-77 TaxID=1080068 RepID=UPI00074D3D22|nr:hypothetical protein [Leptolyngbya sp. O-77]BAU41611.1 hypothetical protein O77CONTIG1_01423 [Leptolyngbya sp. O-77]
MDSFQEQIVELNAKVDALHQVIEQLSNRITEVFSEVLLVDRGQRSPAGATSARQSYSQRYGLDTEMDHKDVLSDDNFLESDSHSGERSLSPEVQIQRLTAQLTAAYNRIAALEEQLLSQRIH